MRQVLVDASVFITLSAIGNYQILNELDDDIVVPQTVADEIVDDPETDHLTTASNAGWLTIDEYAGPETEDVLSHAAAHLGSDLATNEVNGDVVLLAMALDASEETVILTDDKPLRKVCKALGIPISGSIGILIVAVEQQELTPDAAKQALIAMDEVGARLSARLYRQAEQLIEEAATQ